MSTRKGNLPSIMYLVASALFLLAAFLPGGEPPNRLFIVLALALLFIAAWTFRWGGDRTSAAD